MLIRGRDFELVPEAVWKALSAWYGGSPALPRSVSTVTIFKFVGDITCYCVQKNQVNEIILVIVAQYFKN